MIDPRRLRNPWEYLVRVSADRERTLEAKVAALEAILANGREIQREMYRAQLCQMPPRDAER